MESELIHSPWFTLSHVCGVAAIVLHTPWMCGSGKIWGDKENKIIFLEFLKYWPSSHDFNKLVIKAKMHDNTFFFEVFFVV